MDAWNETEAALERMGILGMSGLGRVEIEAEVPYRRTSKAGTLMNEQAYERKADVRWAGWGREMQLPVCVRV